MQYTRRRAALTVRGNALQRLLLRLGGLMLGRREVVASESGKGPLSQSTDDVAGGSIVRSAGSRPAAYPDGRRGSVRRVVPEVPLAIGVGALLAAGSRVAGRPADDLGVVLDLLVSLHFGGADGPAPLSLEVYSSPWPAIDTRHRVPARGSNHADPATQKCDREDVLSCQWQGAGLQQRAGRLFALLSGPGRGTWPILERKTRQLRLPPAVSPIGMTIVSDRWKGNADVVL